MGDNEAVERAKLQLAENDRQRRYLLWKQVLDGTRVVLWIAATSLPLLVVEQMTKDIAGKTTTFSLGFKMSIAVSVMTSIGWTQSAIRSHYRKGKVQRQRVRLEQLEARLSDLQSVEEA